MCKIIQNVISIKEQDNWKLFMIQRQDYPQTFHFQLTCMCEGEGSYMQGHMENKCVSCGQEPPEEIAFVYRLLQR